MIDSSGNQTLGSISSEHQPWKRSWLAEFAFLSILFQHVNRLFFLQAYNAMRQFCGLRRASSFDDLKDTIETSVIGKLSSAYA